MQRWFTAHLRLSRKAAAMARLGVPWDHAPGTLGPRVTHFGIVPHMDDRGEPQQVSVGGIPSAEAFGTPHVSISASREWLVEGYVRALARFRAASEQDDKSARDTFLP